VTGIEVPIYLQYEFTAGAALARFLSPVREGRIVGQRCPGCASVYVPARGSCSRCGIPTEEEVEVADRGVIEAFTIVHIPMPGNPIKPPFIAANILLDGTDMACLHLVSEVPDRAGARRDARAGGMEAARGVGLHLREHRLVQAGRGSMKHA
jgi:uncharacterized OB-fold protein